jgi:hypothetical protein
VARPRETEWLSVPGAPGREWLTVAESLTEQIFEHLQFSTAVPFGYLLFFFICLVAALWLVTNIIRSTLRRNFLSVPFLGGVSGLGFLALVFYANLAQDLDLNPPFTEADIVGRWIDGDSTLQLNPSGTVHFVFGTQYRYTREPVTGDGTWSRRSDFTIQITSNEPDQTMPILRIVKSNTKYRIILDLRDDPDMWDRHLGFRRSDVELGQ